jgi:type I restriction enzyme R subunit
VPAEVGTVPGRGTPGQPGERPEPPTTGGERIKYVIKDVPVYVVNERVQYYGPDGRLITESLRDYTRIQIGKRFASLDDFLKTWNDADRKAAVIAELESQGILFEELAKETGKALDPFDLVCHIAFGRKPLTRRERANNVKKRNVFGKYGEQARAVLEALLEKFADHGVQDIEDAKVLELPPFDQFGSKTQIRRGIFGSVEQYTQAVQELEQALYDQNELKQA